MSVQQTTGRVNQRLRTRQDILRATAQLLKNGASPSMEEIAEAARVSRATLYRYFPNLESLLVEAPLDGNTPNAEELFEGDPSGDPVERLDRAEAALHEMSYRNEAQLRLMLAHAVRREAHGDADSPHRQNRRTGLIEAALEPVRDRLDPENYERLCSALALVFGIESMIVYRDVVPITPEAAREVKSWAIRALTEAALHNA